MDLQLSGKVILVSGGAKGIGKAIVTLLAKEGATPVIIDKDEASGAALARALSVPFVQADLTDPEACRSAVEESIRQCGRIDGLVNNAGFNDSIGLENGDYQKFVSSLQKNLIHAYLLAHHAVPQLKQHGGTIVNIASKVAVTGQGGTSGYAAAKGGILALTREWAVELLPHHVRVNAVLPAEVWTPLYEQWVSRFPNPEEKKASIERNIPLEHRMTKPEEIADTVAFLLSSRSSHITGQWLFVDGGYTHLDRSIPS